MIILSKMLIHALLHCKVRIVNEHKVIAKIGCPSQNETGDARQIVPGIVFTRNH